MIAKIVNLGGFVAAGCWIGEFPSLSLNFDCIFRGCLNLHSQQLLNLDGAVRVTLRFRFRL